MISVSVVSKVCLVIWVLEALALLKDFLKMIEKANLLTKNVLHSVVATLEVLTTTVIQKFLHKLLCYIVKNGISGTISKYLEIQQFDIFSCSVTITQVCQNYPHP